MKRSSSSRASFSNGQSAPRQLGFSGLNRSSGQHYCHSILRSRSWEPRESDASPIDTLILNGVDELALEWFAELRYRDVGPVPYLLANLDDAEAGRLVAQAHVPYITFGRHPHAHVRAASVSRDSRGTTICLETPLGCQTIFVRDQMPGCETWVLAAVALGLALRTELADIAAALEENGCLELAA